MSEIISYVCSGCGAMVNNDWDILDNGTILECSECEEETIVNLCKREDYPKTCASKAMYGKLKELEFHFTLHSDPDSSKKPKEIQQVLAKAEGNFNQEAEDEES